MNRSTIYILILAAGALASARVAHADVDVVAAIDAVCKTTPRAKLATRESLAALDRVCALPVQIRATLAPATLVPATHDATQRLPLSFFAPDLCKDVALLTPFATDASAVSALQTACGFKTPATSSPLDSVFVNIVSGLGEHIAAVARQDLVDYVTENLTSTFCKIDPKNLLALGDLFPTTCRLFDATVTPIDSLTLSGVKAAFLVDAKGLRKTLPPKLEPIAIEYLKAHPTLAVISAISGSVAIVIYEVFVAKTSANDLLTAAETWVEQNYPKPAAGVAPKKLCSLVTDPRDVECIALLGMKLVTTFRIAHANHEELVGAAPRIVDRAAAEFCAEHTFPLKADTACVIDPKYVTRWHDKILRFYDALFALYDESNTLSHDPDKKSRADGGAALSKASFPELSADIREVFAAFLALCDDGTPAYQNTASLYLAVIDLALAAAQQDVASMRTPLLQILDNPIVKPRLGDFDEIAKSAVNFVTALAAAKDSTEAKAVIDAIAAPAGTYKEKYRRSKTYVAIGAVIGPSIVQQYKLSSVPATTAFVSRFSSPVGIELMPSWLSGKWNLGIVATLIDPLAMVASDKDGNTPDTNIGAVIDLGGYLRLGVYKSPISIVAGTSWRPGARTSSDCMVGCYKGTFEMFAGIVADVPLLVLH